MIVTDKNKVLGVLKDISDQFTLIEGARGVIKDHIDAAAEEHEIDKKQLRKLARTYHKQNFSTEVADQETFQELYTTITGARAE